MLHALLNLHLDEALLLANLQRHVAQLMGEHLAEAHYQGGDKQQDDGQTAIHGVHQQEGSRQLYAGNSELWQQGCGDVGHGIDVLRQA